MPHLSLTIAVNTVLRRDAIIMNYVAGKTVTHFGCIDDDAETIARKNTAGTWLHSNVTKASKRTYGIDLNREMIPVLKEKLGIDNIYQGDIQDAGTFTCPGSVFLETEILLIPDVIEHLDNPGGMLRGIREKFNAETKIIITTPNPFMIMNFYDTLRRREGYSKWHTCYFSLANMKVLLERHGFSLLSVHPYFRDSNSASVLKAGVSGFLKKTACRISRGFADGYLYVCSISSSAAKPLE